MSRIIFGSLLGLIGLLYLWLALQSVWPSMQNGDWVGYLGAAIFLAAGVVATLAAVNLLRPKRR